MKTFNKQRNDCRQAKGAKPEAFVNLTAGKIEELSIIELETVNGSAGRGMTTCLKCICIAYHRKN